MPYHAVDQLLRDRQPAAVADQLATWITEAARDDQRWTEIAGVARDLASLVHAITGPAPPASPTLREVLTCLLGADERVEHALDLVTMAARHRRRLLVSGDADLVAVARILHRHANPAGPFIECNPRRCDADESERGPRNVCDGTQALLAANGGTLCIHAARRPKDYLEIVARQRGQAQLIICSPRDRSSPIVVRTFTSRSGAEKERIVAVLGSNALHALESKLPAHATFSAADARWIQDNAKTFDDIDKATRRLIALRAFAGNETHAANSLRMTAPALSTWRRHRKLPAL